jgi:hypothetical protein
MNDPRDDEALRLEIDAVRQASQPGEIVASSPDEQRSFWFYVRRTFLHVILWLVLIVAVTFGATLVVTLFK